MSFLSLFNQSSSLSNQSQNKNISSFYNQEKTENQLKRNLKIKYNYNEEIEKELENLKKELAKSQEKISIIEANMKRTKAFLNNRIPNNTPQEGGKKKLKSKPKPKPKSKK
jgi:septal ring factor EnvC (AmiA/AmiB activator)